jgi:hypothetical protein
MARVSLDYLKVAIGQAGDGRLQTGDSRQQTEESRQQTAYRTDRERLNLESVLPPLRSPLFTI